MSEYIGGKASLELGEKEPFSLFNAPRHKTSLRVGGPFFIESPRDDGRTRIRPGAR